MEEEKFEDDNFDEVDNAEVEDVESSEEGFIKGYEEDEEVLECAECGRSITSESKKVVKEIEGEKYSFCSKECAEEFEESLGKTEES